MSDDQQTQFLLHVLKHSTLFQPDFSAVAEALNISNAGHVARRFQTILNKQGFEFDQDSSQVQGDGELPQEAIVLKTPAKKGKIKTEAASTGKTQRSRTASTKSGEKRRNKGDVGAKPTSKNKKPNLGLATAAPEHQIYDGGDEDAEFEDDDLDLTVFM